jgi:hypothetical protein
VTEYGHLAKSDQLAKVKRYIERRNFLLSDLALAAMAGSGICQSEPLHGDILDPHRPFAGSNIAAERRTSLVKTAAAAN